MNSGDDPLQKVLHKNNNQKKSLHSQEVEILAKTIYGEARGESNRGKEAVAHTILNRYKISQTTKHQDWWGNNIVEICLQPYQFSCWNESDPNLPKLKALNSSDDNKTYRQCLKIAKQVLSGNSQDMTNGATHYFNPRHANPKWHQKMVKTATIGNHVFYK